MNNGYAICFNEWSLDPDIKNELGLLLIISSLTAEKGYCFASNKYFAELFKTTEISISRKINKLANKKYITLEYEKRGCEVISRKIRLTKMLTDDYQKCYSTINKNVKENNISNNNTSNNKKEIYKERFIKPTLEEVKAYCTQRNNKIDAQRFIDFYEANNWTDSKGNKVKSWKQKIITWESHQPKQSTKKDIVPEWFDKDLNTKQESEEDDLNDEQRKLINEILGSNKK